MLQSCALGLCLFACMVGDGPSSSSCQHMSLHPITLPASFSSPAWGLAAPAQGRGATQRTAAHTVEPTCHNYLCGAQIDASKPDKVDTTCYEEDVCVLSGLVVVSWLSRRVGWLRCKRCRKPPHPTHHQQPTTATTPARNPPHTSRYVPPCLTVNLRFVCR